MWHVTHEWVTKVCIEEPRIHRLLVVCVSVPLIALKKYKSYYSHLQRSKVKSIAKRFLKGKLWKDHNCFHPFWAVFSCSQQFSAVLNHFSKTFDYFQLWILYFLVKIFENQKKVIKKNTPKMWHVTHEWVTKVFIEEPRIHRVC